MDDRRVYEGGLGCPNCREVFPISAGVADLRMPPRRALEEEARVAPTEDQIGIAHALLGVAEGPGELAVLGSAGRFGPGLARSIPGIEVVAAGGARGPEDAVEGLSRMVVGPRLPFGDRGLRGVLLEGDESDEYLREAARILAPGHRVVVLDAPTDAAGRLIASGLTVRLQERGVVVAGR